MKSKYNREWNEKQNVLEENAQTEKKKAWIKLVVPENFAQALMRDWMSSDMSDVEDSLDNVALVWKDKGGLTFAPAGKSLRETLREDILARYDNCEHHDVFMEDEEASNEGMTEDILNRYDNAEYWDRDIAVGFLDEEYISDDDAELIRWMIPDDEIVAILITQKTEV